MVATKASLGELSSYGLARSTVKGAPLSEEELRKFTAAGIDINALADRLQDEGTKSFAKSWTSLMAVIASKREPGAKAA